MKKIPYYTYRTYMINKYSEPLYSIPVDLDLGCPNRELDGSGGCTFCPENGARATQNLNVKSVEEQIVVGIDFAKRRYKAKRFMLYIQAYTGTFTSVIKQKEMYSHLLKQYNFDAISIGTRPDCINTSTLEYLQELNSTIDVHVDLGIQSLNDETLIKINRGHDSQCSIDAIKKLQEYGIKVFAHTIVGLEGETRVDWVNTIQRLCELNVDGIKIHNLHIIKNTLLANEYEAKKFKIYNEYEYAEELMHLLRIIPSHIPIIRISTDTPTDNLIAPIWHMQKGQFGEYVIEQMNYREITQGDLVQKKEPKILDISASVELADGSVSFWDKKHKSYYHPKSGASRQAKELFIEKSSLKQRLEKNDVHLLDIGFGMGYNSLEALSLNKIHKLKIIALDKNKSIILKSSKVLKDKTQAKILEQIYENGFYEDTNSLLKLILGDVRYTLTNLKEKFDVIFLDPFLQIQNPSMLTLEICKIIKTLLKSDGVLVCSTSTEAIRAALSQANFKSEVSNIDNSDIKGLIATHGNEKIDAVPYRDHYLIYRDKQIVTNREEEVKSLK
ncbi:MAG: radical SAM protein (TIGR01212 family) [Sulfurimonas sp.]|jgi:radical SAM protein (TIGR01212 family)